MELVSNVIAGTNAERVLLLVHGYGADEQDLAGLLPYLDPDGYLAVVLPRGPIPVELPPTSRSKLALAHFLEKMFGALAFFQTRFIDGFVGEIHVVLLAETLAR